MAWLGTQHDGEIVRQRERIARHKEVAHQLLASGGARGPAEGRLGRVRPTSATAPRRSWRRCGPRWGGVHLMWCLP